MPDLNDGDEVQVPGSGASVYTLKRQGDVYQCSCPAWQFQGAPVDQRTCKHLRKYIGDAEETARVGTPSPASRARSSSGGSSAAVKKDSAPPLLLAHKWEAEHDPAGWWMSEKLDGVRAYWDGAQLISRLGNAFAAPDWFIEELPEKTPLDGELFLDRGEFQKTISVVRSGSKSDAWKDIRYRVFDAPEVDEPFEKRLEIIAETLEGLEYAEALAHELCDDIDHLKEELERILDLGGEGLMLRQPGSKYIAGRSTSLLKVKTFYDAEGRVKTHVPGKGKHKGRLGALEVELKDGTVFNVGTGFSDREREDPPKLGAIVTFRYQELTKAGVPRFPSFVGERVDVTWDTLQPLPQNRGSGASAKPTPAKARKPRPAPAPRSTPSPKPTPSPKSTPAATSSGGASSGGAVQGFRRLEFDDGSSQKFWEVATRGSDVLVRFGKLGTDGRVHIKQKKTEAEARAHADQQADSKLAKGYDEIAGAQPPPELTTPPANTTSAGGQGATVVTQTQHQRGTGDDLRRLEFDDGSSQKFWEIERWGNELVIRFGKLGTEGQVRVKSYDSSSDARDDAVKLADGKINKGYAEVATQGVIAAGQSSTAPASSGSAVPDRTAIVTSTDHQRGDGDSLRRLEHSGSKFWEVERFGDELVLRWGKLGTEGHVRVKSYADADAAQEEADAQADTKLARGYSEV